MDVLSMAAISVLLMDKVHTSVVLLYATFHFILQLSEQTFSMLVENVTYLLKFSIVICNVLVKLQDPKASCMLHHSFRALLNIWALIIQFQASIFNYQYFQPHQLSTSSILSTSIFSASSTINTWPYQYSQPLIAFLQGPASGWGLLVRTRWVFVLFCNNPLSFL